MISRAANRTSSERPSSTSLRPSISAFSFSRVRSDAGILSIGVLLRRGRSPNRTSLISPFRRGCTPTLFPASLGLHRLLKRLDKPVQHDPVKTPIAKADAVLVMFVEGIHCRPLMSEADNLAAAISSCACPNIRDIKGKALG